MDASEDTLPIRPPCKTRKSVSFTDETELVDLNGQVTMAFTDDSKDTAQSHSPATPPLSEALNDFADQAERATPPFPAAADDAEPAEAATIPALDEPALDLSMMKKKKKKVKKVEDDFTAKLKALEVDENEDGAGAGAGAGDGAATATADGDMFAGTGIWAHDETRAVSYDLLVSRFYALLNQKIPDHTIGGTRSKIPPPQCLREGNKKTIFANIADICKRMKRSEEHVTAYLFAELGTNGSVDGSRRLVIKGKFTQKMIEGVVRKYILEYVTCKTCRSGDTELSKGENRLYFITCNSCGSRRSVAAVKTGFSAQIGRRKKQG